MMEKEGRGDVGGQRNFRKEKGQEKNEIRKRERLDCLMVCSQKKKKKTSRKEARNTGQLKRTDGGVKCGGKPGQQKLQRQR